MTNTNTDIRRSSNALAVAETVKTQVASSSASPSTLNKGRAKETPSFDDSDVLKTQEEKEKELKEFLSRKDISSKQIAYIKYLAYQCGTYGDYDWNKVAQLNQYQARCLIEDLQ